MIVGERDNRFNCLKFNMIGLVVREARNDNKNMFKESKSFQRKMGSFSRSEEVGWEDHIGCGAQQFKQICSRGE